MPGFYEVIVLVSTNVLVIGSTLEDKYEHIIDIDEVNGLGYLVFFLNGYYYDKIWFHL